VDRTQHAVVRNADPDGDLARSEKVAIVIGLGRAPAEPLSRRVEVSADGHLDLAVLYASSARVGAFLETLARYRTDLAIVAE
jgi:hypothetical protein